MNDDQLKREIERMLSVDPSPQFAARVGARIVEHRKVSRLRWSFGIAAFASIAMAVAFVSRESKNSARPSTEVVMSTPEQKVGAPSLPSPQLPAAVRRAMTPSVPIKREPEVLFDPREAAAFQKFVDGVRDKRIDLGKLIELQEAASQRAPIEEIALMPIDDLAPIVLEPLSSGPRKVEGESL